MRSIPPGPVRRPIGQNVVQRLGATLLAGVLEVPAAGTGVIRLNISFSSRSAVWAAANG